jgi:glycerophosphoryl diester phosphodiesterase
MTQIISHRGYSAKYPENTMIAFQRAVELGTHGIELDVQMSKDGEIVICHDETIDRTSNGSGYIKDMTVKELKQYDFGSKFNRIHAKYEFQEIPTLKEYFEYIKDFDVFTNVELKTNIFKYEGIQMKLWDLIKEFEMEERTIISSFNHHSIMEMKKIAPHIKCGFLTMCGLLHPGTYTKQYSVECYHPVFRSLTEEDIKNCQSENIEINTYTVNDEKQIMRLIDYHITNIITDETELGLRLI